MIVRVPVDLTEASGEYRDFRIGSVIAADPIARLVRLRFEVHAPGEAPKVVEQEYNDAMVVRCLIAADTMCLHVPSRRRILVLTAATDTVAEHQLTRYYTQAEDGVDSVTENELLPPAHRQRPQVESQLLHYELHPPSWRFFRDPLLSTLLDLKSAAFGLEDLVGTRVLLMAHQAETIARVLQEETPRFILADEVGLGKTIQACVILKGLMRRNPALRTLIIVPESLHRQWQFELDGKFWLRFATQQADYATRPQNFPGMLITAEALEQNAPFAAFIERQTWDLLIVDEAHHLHKRPQLYDHVYRLSQTSPFALILSATPIQRRAQELFFLLKLLDSDRYGDMAEAEFETLLEQQASIRQAVNRIGRQLNSKRFDPANFMRLVHPLTTTLAHDHVLPQLLENVEESRTRTDKGLRAAGEVMQYVSTNYRLEGKMIRNRRVTLLEHNVPLPTRALDTTYTYRPDEAELDTWEALYQYAERAFEGHDSEALDVQSPSVFNPQSGRVEIARLLFHAAASSPHVLQRLVAMRLSLWDNATQHAEFDKLLVRPVSPGNEHTRMTRLLATVPPFDGEQAALERANAVIARWLNVQAQFLPQIGNRTVPQTDQHRLVQVIRAVQAVLRENVNAKILFFSSWFTTLGVFKDLLKRLYGSEAVAEFHVNIDKKDLQSEVNKFQANARCHFLLCDELGGEGRNFQIADCIFHLDLPWTPAVLEQRIGRVDRLGRTGVVTSYVFYAHEGVEHALFRLWQDAYSLFTRSMSGMEIALEAIQDQVSEAFIRNPRRGIDRLVEPMQADAETLREAVEEERYFEDVAINRSRREEFDRLSRRTENGAELREAVLGWAHIAGLRFHYDDEADLVTFEPEHFNAASMDKAKFFTAPNMVEAYTRGSQRQLKIKGTFNRTVGVRRESLVFFSPGTDAWTDTLIANALEADRARCTAAQVHGQSLAWDGFDLLYSISVDPRPLYALGAAPSHLLHAQGYLAVTTQRVWISKDGQSISPADPLFRQLEAVRQRRTPKPEHLGKRGGGQLGRFKAEFPPDVWETMVNHATTTGLQKVQADFEFMHDEAEIARSSFEAQAAGMRARAAWLTQQQERSHKLSTHREVQAAIATFERITEALVDGIARPRIQLESACYWMIRSERAR